MKKAFLVSIALSSLITVQSFAMVKKEEAPTAANVETPQVSQQAPQKPLPQPKPRQSVKFDAHNDFGYPAGKLRSSYGDNLTVLPSTENGITVVHIKNQDGQSNQNPTFGILVSRDDQEYVIEYVPLRTKEGGIAEADLIEIAPIPHTDKKDSAPAEAPKEVPAGTIYKVPTIVKVAGAPIVIFALYGVANAAYHIVDWQKKRNLAKESEEAMNA